jgi:Tfp pilus assembly protein PilX
VAKQRKAKVASDSIHTIHRNVINARRALRAAEVALARADKAIVANKKKKLTYAEISRSIGGKPGDGTYSAIRKLAEAKKAQR